MVVLRAWPLVLFPLVPGEFEFECDDDDDDDDDDDEEEEDDETVPFAVIFR